MSVRVSCVVKDDRFSRYESIQSIGGVNPDGSNWKLSLQDAIVAIERGTYGEFYVERPTGDRVRVVVAERNGKKYLRTSADGDEPNNLLSLPRCP
ncbi:hypothetical protein MFU01_41790 [Myxococcus fulvus]|uniref:DUF3892 domain-containing protein n=1 Tax=Myxococcus fulvus TaxID=33 RepID=A0A511T6K4_MYXFU|nr:hypothetical protein MFU01_41790 [Myxococcus fulvus]